MRESTYIEPFQKEKFFDILGDDIDLDDELSEVPKKRFVLPLIKKNLGVDSTESIPDRIDEESLEDIYGSVEEMVGGYGAELIYDILKRPLLLKELREVRDLESLDPSESKEYLEALLDFEESYLGGESWKKAVILLQAAENLLDNIECEAKERYRGRLENNWGLYFWKSGDYDLAEKKFNSSLKISREIGHKSLTASAYHGLGVLYGDAKEDKKLAVEKNEKCIEILRELEQTNKNLRKEASVLNNIGVAYHKMAEDSRSKSNIEEEEENLKKAAENYREAIDLAVKLNYKHMVGWVSFNLGEVYALLGENDKALECSRDSRDIYERELEDDRGLSGVEMLDAVIDLESGDHRDALAHINRSLELREKLGEPRRTADALVCRGDINLGLDELDDARQDYKTALEIYRSIGSDDGVERVKKKIQAI